jgi:hypothetical protein
MIIARKPKRMPITLPPITRRHFLRGTLTAGVVAALSPRFLSAADAPPTDPHRLALLSDIHIDASKDFGKMDAVPFASFAQASNEIIGLPPPPPPLHVNRPRPPQKGHPPE